MKYRKWLVFLVAAPIVIIALLLAILTLANSNTTFAERKLAEYIVIAIIVMVSALVFLIKNIFNKKNQ